MKFDDGTYIDTYEIETGMCTIGSDNPSATLDMTDTPHSLDAGYFHNNVLTCFHVSTNIDDASPN